LDLKGLDESASILKCGILLSRQQEFHLFRKYNYLKYRISKQAEANLEKLKGPGLAGIEKNICKMQEVRNILMKCNMRLVVRPSSKYGSDSLKKEEFFSNGYVHMMKAIDCFDYRKGFKFSTYFINVLFRNFQRDKTNIAKKSCDYLKSEPQDKREIDYREVNESYNERFVKEILSTVSESLKGSRKDSKIRVAVIKKYFGIDDGEPKTFRGIGKELGFSRERVRVLINDTIKILKKSNFSYDPLS
jgi:RNA polymerase sigma factor (sigma-70 family)